MDRSLKQKASPMDCLCEDLVENILARVPLKPRTRFKCVSKGWCKIIIKLRKIKSSTTSSGLVLTLEPFETKFTTATFLTVQDKGKPCNLLTTYDVVLNKNPKLMVSFNGLLLYRVQIMPHTTQFYICSCPVLNQYLSLPPIQQGFGHLILGLFPLGSRQDEFKVICFSLVQTNRASLVEFHIFSSDTWAWSIHRARIVGTVFYPTFDECLFHYPRSVYNKGKLYWIYSQISMLIYNVNEQLFKFVWLPDAYDNLCPYLYVSEGCLYYCQSNRHQLVIWAYLGDDNDFDDDCTSWDHHMNKWRITHSISMKELVEHTSETYGLGDNRNYAVCKPVAFNDELQILYMLKPGFIWAYSPETRKITRVWSSPMASNGMYMRFDIFPFVFDQ